ncbi:putative enoyl-CoA hydratase echA8 [compost metagenome]
MDMLLTGDRMGAEQAQRIGLVSRLASDSAKLLEEVRAFAQRIACKPPTASAYVKQAARAALEMDLKRGLDLELDLFALLAPTKDAREAAQAFSERREPRFTGE